MNARLHDLIKIFNTLQTVEDRVAFQAQWKTFMSGLNTADRRFAIQSLQESILANLVAYRQDIEAMIQDEQLSEEDKEAFKIPADWFKPGRLPQ